ncbi:NAD-P-binding protein [Stereum hirsutum FP-91666 SS1]|uniref:NAD-P-binding protein n=1 Tax=Stereum hirsutum (strain FP-91666) TaxID=721885 RepID=UPI000440CD39|nr:NAD-P-binding protein [Stereum hirsutum FP-91666 SS1]EIM92264.1 NAD-P-binding protein [Stereum hirsutum FP-91666 SS1]
MAQSAHKVVICGAGFLGGYIATAISGGNLASNTFRRIQLASRNPEGAYSQLAKTIPKDHLLPPIDVDVTKPETLQLAFQDAYAVVSLVGVLQGSPEQFEKIQWRGAENVAAAAKQAGARLVHFSAIGADAQSKLPYARTKALGEQAAFRHCPDATAIRPSIVFGPGDGFFARFTKLSKILPFMPTFGGGTSKFQPVYVGDIAKLVEIITRDDPAILKQVKGKVIEAGGPDVITYRQVMELVLRYGNRTRPILSLPWAIGSIQGALLEQFPPNLFTITRDQVEQLKDDNVVTSNPTPNHVSFESILKGRNLALTSVHEILPTYLPYI